MSLKSDQSSVVLPNTLSSSEEDLCQAVEQADQDDAENEANFENGELEVEEIGEHVVVPEVEQVNVQDCEVEQIAVQQVKFEQAEIVKAVQEVKVIEEDKPETVAVEEEKESAVVVEQTVDEEPQLVDEVEDESASQVSSATATPSVAKPRRRRGKRSGQQQSEKQRSAQLRQNETVSKVKTETAEITLPTIKVEHVDAEPAKRVSPPKTDDQWESIPVELKTTTNVEQWETSTRTRRSRKVTRQHVVHQQEEEEEEFVPEKVEEELVPAQKSEPIDIAQPTVEEVVEVEAPRDTERASSVPERSPSSAPSSRRSTLKKQNRKKRPSLDDGKSEKSSSNGSATRPVLIQDGLIDITAGGLLTSRPLIRRPTDITDELALMIKDIGHGMRDGPITMGRFGIGKYTPPDRSDEILSSIVARQIQDEAAEKAQEEENADSSSSPSVVVVDHSQDLDLD
jgi:hypothetical protein